MALEVVTLTAGDLEARWVPGAGMVGASLRHRGDELLGQRGGLEAYVGRGSTFGVPLLHPWANRLGGFAYTAAKRTVALEAGMPGLRTEEHGLPIHGVLAAASGWEVLDRRPDRLLAALQYATPALLAAFPYPHELRLEVTLTAERLEIVTTLLPGDAGPVPVSFGFHPYLALRDGREGSEIELPVRTRLVLDDRGIPTGAREAVSPVPGPPTDLDALFTDLTGAPFVLRTAARTVRVHFRDGFTHAQVFAPPGQPVVCFEPMTAPTDALRSGDGLRLATAPFAARFAIEVT